MCTRVIVTDRLARGLDFMNWQQRHLWGWPWSANSVQVRDGMLSMVQTICCTDRY